MACFLSYCMKEDCGRAGIDLHQMSDQLRDIMNSSCIDHPGALTARAAEPEDHNLPQP